MSEVALGSWLTLGSSVDRSGTAELVRRAFDRGINFFDTADVYAEGEAERALGAALADLPRRQLVIGTKCFFPMSRTPNDRGLSRKHIVESVDGSLQRLGTDYIDLMQCHRADPDTPIEETVRCFDDLIRQGKLLYWGVSEWSGEQIREACLAADRLGCVRPISNQPEYNLLQRRIEAQVIPVCREEGLSQLVYSPLAQGALTGKYSGGKRPGDSRGADSVRNVFMADFLDEAVLQRVDRLTPLAAELGLTMAQLSLAWCLREPNVASTIVGATRRAQLEDNADAAGRQLPAKLLERIDAALGAP